MDETSTPARDVWPRYLSAFKRHKIIVILPVILALEAGLAFGFTRPHKYTAATTVFFDTPVLSPSAGVPGQPYSGSSTPAQSGQASIGSWLGTREGLVAVGRASAPLMARLTAQHVPASAIDDKIVAALGSSFATSVVGQGVNNVAISMTNTNAGIMDETLQALVEQYKSEFIKQQSARLGAQIDSYKTVVDSKKGLYDAASADSSNYQTAHPGVTALTDITLAQKSSAATSAYSAYIAALQSLQDAQQSLKTVGSSVSYYQVDKPQPPVALPRKKKIAFAGVAGLLAGAIVSLLLLAGLANGDRTARRPEDIDDVLDLEVVGNISEFARSEADTPRSRRTRSS